jgi:hypothetical protein
MTTWYVRPNTSHNATRNGTSYANAWGGWSEIVWGASGVKTGDDLYVCGAHVYATGITVGVHTAVVAPVTIRGDLAADPGSISFTTLTDTLTMARACTNLLGFTNVAAVTHNGAAVNCRYLYNTFNTPGSTSGIRFGAVNDFHSDIEIRGNTFNTIAPSPTVHAAIRWWVQTGSNSSMTRCTIEKNTFTNQANRSVIEFRTQNDSNAAATMTDIKVNYNTWSNYAGTALGLDCPGTLGLPFAAHGVQVRGNTFTNGLESPTAVFGGCIGLTGWGPSTTPGFGDNLVADNVATNIVGPTSFVDTFWGSYLIQDNVGDGFTTNSIDGNGIILDIGTVNTIVRRNRIKNAWGKAGVFNSGCGLMILGQCTNNQIYGNWFSGMQTGIFLGDTQGACDNKVHNNVFLGVTQNAVYIHSTAALLNGMLCANNFFGGDGYSVRDLSGANWTMEQFNTFSGFSLGTSNHTLGSRSVTRAAGIASALYADANLSGLDAGMVASLTALPNSVLHLQ